MSADGFAWLERIYNRLMAERYRLGLSIVHNEKDWDDWESTIFASETVIRLMGEVKR